tara:strand:+ start:2217 stop:3332 length:1116 start_codon:yes stop_codon:yes gene_type:complete
MIKFYHISFKALIFGVVLFLSSCDEDYVNSLTSEQPVVYLDTNDNLNSMYLGESVDELELILKVENSPAISQLAFSVNVESDFLNPEQIVISPNQDNLFYNVNPNGEIYFIADATDDTFSGNIGFSNHNQDTTYTYGDGEIARLYLSGINAQSEFVLSIDQALSYDDFEIDVSNWNINSNLNLGQPVPKLSFIDFNYTNNSAAPYLSVILSVDDLPIMTKGIIEIDYDNDLLFFVNETNPSKGDLLSEGFDVSINEQNGLITFSFEHSDGDIENFTNGSGSLVELKFQINNTNFQLQQSPISIERFSAFFIESVYDICGDCLTPNYSEYYNYDINYWNGFIEPVEIHFGCMDSNALNYNSLAIIDDGTCAY